MTTGLLIDSTLGNVRSRNLYQTSTIALDVPPPPQVRTFLTRPERTIEASVQRCVRRNKATESQSDDGLTVSGDILVSLPSLRGTKKKKMGGRRRCMKRSKRAHAQTANMRRHGRTVRLIITTRYPKQT